jgi:hypothetical protein
LTSIGTLVCCVLPAVMVSIGAGAALAGLVSAAPQLIWLSEQKEWVFGAATAALAVSGALLWNARRLPCPADRAKAEVCASLRRWSHRIYGAAVVLTLIGAVFAFGLPLL